MVNARFARPIDSEMVTEACRFGAQCVFKVVTGVDLSRRPFRVMADDDRHLHGLAQRRMPHR